MAPLVDKRLSPRAGTSRSAVCPDHSLSTVALGAPCKTVGSAYVGSNPTPATQNPRSEPLTRTCVSGSIAEKERFGRPLPVAVGQLWARSWLVGGLLRIGARDRPSRAVISGPG